MDGEGGIRGGCLRCHLLFEIWTTSLKLNSLIRKFDPDFDDLERMAPLEPDPRQIGLFGD